MTESGTPLAAEKAALAYFASVFVVGFALGTLRVLAIEPAIGPVWSVLLELPVMLTVSWLFAGRIIRRFAVGRGVAERMRMGLIAVVLLVSAELALGIYGFGMPLADQLSAYATPRGLLTIVGQIGFALMPLAAQRNRS